MDEGGACERHLLSPLPWAIACGVHNSRRLERGRLPSGSSGGLGVLKRVRHPKVSSHHGVYVHGELQERRRLGWWRRWHGECDWIAKREVRIVVARMAKAGVRVSLYIVTGLDRQKCVARMRVHDETMRQLQGKAGRLEFCLPDQP